MGKYVATAALIVTVGIVVFSGSGFSVKDSRLPPGRMDASLITKTISHGARVEVEDHLITGRWTVIEFTADW